MKTSRSFLFATLCLMASQTLGLIESALAQNPNRTSSARALADRVPMQLRVEPHWFAEDRWMWYRKELPRREYEYVLVDTLSGQRTFAFDHAKLAEGLSRAGVKEVNARKLSLERLAFDESAEFFEFDMSGSHWRGRRDNAQVEKIEKRSLSDHEVDQTLESNGAIQRSRRTGPETEIVFINHLDRAIELFWLDSSGDRVSYGRIGANDQRAMHTYAGHAWEVIDSDGKSMGRFMATDDSSVAEIGGAKTARANRRPPPVRRESRVRNRPSPRSSDGAWEVRVEDHQLVLKDLKHEETHALTTDGDSEHRYEFLSWSPDGKSIVAVRVIEGDNFETHLLESSPKNGARGVLHSRVYPLPGDRLTTYQLQLFDVDSKKRTACDIEPIDFDSPRPRWSVEGNYFTVEKLDRGHQRYRLLRIEATTGNVATLIDEKTDTFIWSAHTENSGPRRITWLEETNELIYCSEKSGWRHLYLVDSENGEVKNAITAGPWVVRGIDRIDESLRQIWFRACGKEADQDPYFMHHYRVNFDGSELIALTAGDGTHTVQASPTGKYFIDTFSRADCPPTHVLRRYSDGNEVCPLESVDGDALHSAGWNSPEVFTAKARDDQTDIWGLIYRPNDFDPSRKYPIVEDIYAGPQSAYVPKAFSAEGRYQALTELGFVVVKIDGMGTAHRSKAFHDVCWHNLKDAGFPDRIRWIKAAATKDQALDITRVGIFGTSAGGQNAGGAVLFKSEFYKAAVASCGCHDNRMDKASWNEQWMGYPVGAHYGENSNIDNAHRLGGKLLLIVGEMDSNVPPESTLRYADALIKANKDFELLVIPGLGHSDGGPYGQRRMREFFVRHLGGPQ